MIITRCIILQCTQFYMLHGQYYDNDNGVIIRLTVRSFQISELAEGFNENLTADYSESRSNGTVQYQPIRKRKRNKG